MPLNELAVWAQIVAAVTTLFLALLTYLTLRASWAAVNEMKSAREGGDQPRIVAYPEWEDTGGWGSRVYVVVKNVGRSPAIDVNAVVAERDHEGAPVAGLAWASLLSRHLVGPGAYLPAGSSVRRIVMEGAPLEGRADQGFSRVEVTCEWSWSESSRRYREVSLVDASTLLLRVPRRLQPITVPRDKPPVTDAG
jgi:hypothetical protein